MPLLQRGYFVIFEQICLCITCTVDCVRPLCISVVMFDLRFKASCVLSLIKICEIMHGDTTKPYNYFVFMIILMAPSLHLLP